MEAKKRKIGVGKKYHRWAKDTAIKFNLLLDPDRDADLLAYLKSTSYSPNTAIIKALRYYLKTHPQKSLEDSSSD